MGGAKGTKWSEADAEAEPVEDEAKVDGEAEDGVATGDDDEASMAMDKPASSVEYRRGDERKNVRKEKTTETRMKAREKAREKAKIKWQERRQKRR